MKVPPRSRHFSLDLDSAMTPMIDVVFLLLVFFVWTMSFKQVELLLSSNLSKETGTSRQEVEVLDDEADFEQIVIRIFDRNGGVIFQIKENEMKSIKEVKRFLIPINKIQPDAPIVIHPDPGAPMGAVVQVVDMTRTVGFQKVSFAISPGTVP